MRKSFDKRSDAFLSVSVTAVALALSAASASAQIATVMDPFTAGSTLPSGDTVTYTFNGLAPTSTGASGPGLPGGALTGQILLNVNSINSNPVSLTQLATWCVDIFNDLTNSTNTVSNAIKYATSSSTTAPVSGTLLNELTALVQWGFQNINTASPNYATPSNASAADQLAIWELLYGNTYTTSSAAINTLSGHLLADAQAMGSATNYVDGANGIHLQTQTVSGNFTTTYALEEFVPGPTSGNNPNFVSQDLVFLTATVQQSSVVAPLPSTWAMMLTGLLGLGCVGYRRRKASLSAIAA